MEIRILIKENKFWQKYIEKNNIIWIHGFCNYELPLLIEKFNSLNNKEELNSFISTIFGHFGIVFISKKRVIIINDRINSIPIYCYQKNNKLYISPYLNKLKVKFKNKFEKNNNSILQVLMGGFTIGQNLLYDDIKSPVAGHYFLIKKNKILNLKYYDYFDNIDIFSSKEQLLNELSKITLNVFRETLDRIDGRQIVVPLSAGNDSRLVVSCLKHLGIKNVVCYTYGIKNNFESKTAKCIARKLNYQWIFVPLTHNKERKFYKSEVFKNYLIFADSNFSIPYFQGLSSIHYLKKNKLIEDNAVFINGNSGDFISGSHINLLYEKINNSKINKSEVIKILKQEYINKHFSLLGYLKTEKNIKTIEKNIDQEIDHISKELNKQNIHLIYEKLELIDRQSKYVVAGQKSYEYFGHDWFLPLWDDKYLNFWRKIPVEFKFQQNLYKEFLFKENFGDVWNLNLPVNKLNIKPTYLIPIRYFFKILFLAFKLKNWNQFETVFIKYWTDPVLYYKFKSYYEIIKGYRLKPRNVIAYLAIDFVKNLK